MTNIKIPFLLSAAILFSLICAGQKLPSGTYFFKYCDLEYQRCLSKCKVVIRGNRIAVYATKELSKAITNTKEGEIIDKGIIVKQKNGKYIIGKGTKEIQPGTGDAEMPAVIDFKKKKYWTF